MENRCFHCMKPIDGDHCPYCGKSNSDPSLIKETLLLPGTMVAQRYLIGAALDRNGEGVSYLAYDEAVQRRVRLREFFPGTLSHRDSNGKTITVNAGSEIQYKALMTDFVELSRQLIALRTQESCLLRAVDIFTDNATIYTVYEDVACVTFTAYLKDQTRPLSWQKARLLFRPLFDTVALLNARGIVHRGISPDTILVTGDGSLRLKGICTAAARAINSEVKAELFSGYAAPEQYEKCTGHGEWTDVYALGAVLYRTLTGKTMMRADLRTPGDAVPSPAELNTTVPAEVSDTIMKSLAIGCAQRIRSVRQLSDELYRAPEAPVRVVEAEEKPKDKKSGHTQDAKKNGHWYNNLPVWLIVLIVSLPIMLLLFFAAYTIVLGGNRPGLSQSGSGSSETSIEESVSGSEAVSESTEESSRTSSESSRVAGVTVDNFVGKFYDDIVGSSVYSSVFTFVKKEEFDDTTDVGVVIEQDVEEGETVPQGTQITLIVSKGARFVTLPPIEDNNGNPISVSAYRAYLEEAGLSVVVKQVSNPDYESGTIIELDHEIGSVIDRSAVSSITIFVAQ